ncbi:hypothetical protein [Nonomuraea sp. NPDC050786]|uniref:hypothetical protein n=1 Tax=Nonomuraea sp. NPDC050786 TaxID=3154840 RepID=UPI0033DA6DEF
MNAVESAAQRMLPTRTGPDLEPLRLLSPQSPALTAITAPVTHVILVACPTVFGGSVASRTALSGTPDLGVLGVDDLAATRRNVLLG